MLCFYDREQAVSRQGSKALGWSCQDGIAGCRWVLASISKPELELDWVLSFQRVSVSEVNLREVGDGRCWQDPVTCQGSYVQPWWDWKDRICYPFGCGEVTLTTETPYFTTAISSAPSLKELGCVIAGAWRGLARFLTALSLGADMIFCCFFEITCVTVEKSLGPFPTWRRDLS